MEFLRTPDERFANLPAWPHPPRYVDVPAGDAGGGALRMHYVDAGPPEADPVLLLHGEPSWSYLYRKVIATLVGAGLRAVAPDLVGFGRSDKPLRREDYTYQRHVDWTAALVRALDLRHVTLVGQDWGGLVGLRLVAEDTDRFDRVVAANTFLPTGDQPAGEAFLAWRKFSQEVPEFPVGKIVRGGCACAVDDDVIAAYDAPFPDERYKAGARQFPLLVPISPEDPAAPANKRAWEALREFRRPFLTAFGSEDKITRGADFLLQALVPGTHGQSHETLVGAGHFLQEDKGEELGRVIVAFIEDNPRA